MNTYRMNDMEVTSSQNKKLYYDFDMDDNKDCESDSYSENIMTDKYDESVIEAMVEKYLAAKEKGMSADEMVNTDSEEDVTESEEEEEDIDEEDVVSEEVTESSEEYSSSESENAMSDSSKDFELIINSAMDAYKNEFGEYPTLDMLTKGLNAAKHGLFNNNYYDDEADSEYECDENDEEFCDELEDALLIASDIGSIDQISLVNKIMDSYYEINETECDLAELKSIISNVTSELKDEASDEILDYYDNNESDDDYDSDYVINDEDIMQGVLDDNIDLENEFDDEFEDALLAASIMGSNDQIYLVDTILDEYYEENGEECSLRELKSIFENIKNELEAEAMEEYDDESDCDDDSESDEEDEDYVISEKDVMQGILDDSIDLEECVSSEEEDEEDEEDVDEFESEDNSTDEDESDDVDYNPEFDEQDYEGDYELFE